MKKLFAIKNTVIMDLTDPSERLYMTGKKEIIGKIIAAKSAEDAIKKADLPGAGWTAEEIKIKGYEIILKPKR